mmetsp:Transcript_83421/g.193901  ORF Transcript_83421/g.193901 Transcript_83421/m.193901 type:complete len:297 (-) Transcript_83421:109-999(-)
MATKMHVLALVALAWCRRAVMALSVAQRPRPCLVPPGLKVVDVSDPRGGTFKMAVRTGGDIVSEALERYGFWEIRHPQEVAELASGQLPNRGTLLDIGAHVGWYSLAFAKFGLKAIAVEPMALNRQAINVSLCLNPDIRSKVRVVPAALVAPGMRVGRCVVMTPRDLRNAGNGNLWCGAPGLEPPCEHTVCEDVASQTADEVVAALKPPTLDVVKLDVEGSECNVLRGGQAILRRFRPKFVQVETKGHSTMQCFMAETVDHRYVMGSGVGHDENRVAVPVELASKRLVPTGQMAAR